MTLDEFAARRASRPAVKRLVHGVRLKPPERREAWIRRTAQLERRDASARLYLPPVNEEGSGVEGVIIANDVFSASRQPSGISSITLLFWGSEWRSPGILVDPIDMVSQTQVVLGTDYFSATAQYGVNPPIQVTWGYVPAEVEGYFFGVPTIIDIADPANNFTDGQVESIANLATTFPRTFFGLNDPPVDITLYLVITPPSIGNNTGLGEHDWEAGGDFAWGWATANFGLDQTLITISHEMIEALTDTDGTTGYRDPSGNEMADVCEPYSAVSNGIAVQSYYSNALDSCVIPDGIDPITLSSGFFVQSTFGGVGNFEVVCSASQGGIVHYWRNNDAAGLPWSKSGSFLSSAPIAGLSLIQSNYNFPGDLYGVAIAPGTGAVSELRRDPSGAWGLTQIYVGQNGGTALVGAVGTPALIQSRSDMAAIVRGTFYLVLAMNDGSLQLFERYNDFFAQTESLVPIWSTGSVIGQLTSPAPAVSVVQTNYDIEPAGFQPILPAQNPPLDALEIIINDGGSLLHFAGPPGGPYARETLAIGNGDLLGRPALIQSSYGVTGNLELVIASQSHGVNHYYRDNDVPANAWTFGATLPFEYAGDVSLIEGRAGTLEVIVIDQDHDYVGSLSRNAQNVWQPVVFIGTAS